MNFDLTVFIIYINVARIAEYMKPPIIQLNSANLNQVMIIYKNCVIHSRSPEDDFIKVLLVVTNN